MRVSIIQAVLNSPEIVRRQLLHYEKMNLPYDVEVIIVDDGSEPPLWSDNGIGLHPLIYKASKAINKLNISFLETNDKREWTQPAARNFGAKRARGEFCIFTDIDHIISREVIEIARNCPADVVRFKREAGILDEHGNFTQDRDVLREWGFREGGLRLAPHSNSFIIRRDLYLSVGGVSERYVGSGIHPNREEVPFKKKLKPLEKQGKITIWQDQTKPMLYMMPNGRYCGDKDANPFGFFHDLKRKNG